MQAPIISSNNKDMSSNPEFVVPSGEIAQLRIIDTKCSISCLPASRLMSPKMEGFDFLPTMPSLSFLIEGSTGQKALFDLGISKDWKSFAPIVSNRLSTNGYKIESRRGVADVLQDAGWDLRSIDSIVWSHWHWDHLGDPSTFPASTEVVVGPGFTEKFLPAWPEGKESPVRESDFRDRKLREVSFDSAETISIGRFRAIDFFGDGSFYLLDTPGHAVGHLGGLVRTTRNPDTFVFLGGDLCHHSGEMRPTRYLPLPSKIEYPIYPLSMYPCSGAIGDELLVRRGRSLEKPFFDPAGAFCLADAVETIGKAQEADLQPNVLFLYAHESSATSVCDLFPLAANDWKRQGWKDKMLWAFLRDFRTVLNPSDQSI